MFPIFFVTGAPAVGKSAFCRALLGRYPKGLHVPVDDLREWVVSGFATNVGWTEETSRQFAMAEGGACDLARRYQDAGFAVAIDHCAGPPGLDALIGRELSGRLVHRVALVCEQETNLRRSRERVGKPFAPETLEPAIAKLGPLYRTEAIPGWLRVSNEGTLEEAVDALLAEISRTG